MNMQPVIPVLLVQFTLCFISTLTKNVVVRIDSGELSTNLSSLASDNKTRFSSFLGIPYAAPPVDDLRFQAPQTYPKWEGIRNATKFGSVCTQIDFFLLLSTGKPEVTGSEDCLFLNVFTPQVKPEQPLPVLVFIHGGAFTVGGSSQYFVENFMVYPIVMVTFNYRLGVFGYLSSGSDEISGNFALKDQTAVLEWVQRNIHVFGGDPNSVTIIGHSTGSNSIHLHMFSPISAGLFHQAIIMSGSAIAMWSYYPEKYVNSTFNELLVRANCSKNSVKESVSCLKALDFIKLKKIDLELTANTPNPFMFRPVIESPKSVRPFLTEDPRKLNYINAKIPIINGVGTAEGVMNTLLYLKYRNAENFYESLRQELPISTHYKYWQSNETKINETTDMLINYYFQGKKVITKNDVAGLVSIFGNIVFKMPAIDLISSYPGKKYQFVFDYAPARSQCHQPLFRNISGADHSDEVFVLFSRSSNGTDKAISKRMLNYLINFVRTGDPNKGTNVYNLTSWNPVVSKNIEYMRITGDGFRMNSGLSHDENYTLYRSLPIDWITIPNSSARSHPCLFLLIACVGLKFIASRTPTIYF